MALSRTLLAWAALTVLFWAWQEVARRLGGDGSLAPAWRSRLVPPLVEALLLTLLAGLWFGSLGSGGAWLLFALVGALMEIPHRLRAGGTLAWKPALAGIVRVTLAGVLLGFLLG